VEDENQKIIYKASKLERIRKKVWGGVKNLICGVGIHNYPKKDSIRIYGNYIYYGKRCKWCYKEK